MKKIFTDLLETVIIFIGITGFTWLGMSQWLVEMTI